MGTSKVEAVAARRTAEIARAAADELRRLREDVGISQAQLGRTAGVDQALISRIERGVARPRLETYVRLATALGADPSLRFYPNTGPQLHDRHQARIVEAAVQLSQARWRAFPEVGVRHPVRGWIDIALVDSRADVIVAGEVETVVKRFEQTIRWAGAKADAMPSALAWPFGLEAAPTISRLLILRDTAATRSVVATFRATLDAAYPGDPWQALASLAGSSPWPGSALLWSVDRRDRSVELRAFPAGGAPVLR